MKFCIILLSALLLSATAPNPSELTPDWWNYYEQLDEEPDFSGLTARAEGLPDPIRNQANLLIEQLRSNVVNSRLLEQQVKEPVAPPPVLNANYDLDELIALAIDEERVGEEVEALTRRLRAGQERLKVLRTQYGRLQLSYRENTTPSADRFLAGLRLMVRRSNIGVARQRMRLLAEELEEKKVVASYRGVELAHAFDHLEVGPQQVKLLEEERAHRANQLMVVQAAPLGPLPLGLLLRNLEVARAQIKQIDTATRHAIAVLSLDRSKEGIKAPLAAGLEDQRELDHLREQLQVWRDEIDHLKGELNEQAGQEERLSLLAGEIDALDRDLSQAGIVVELLTKRIHQIARGLNGPSARFMVLVQEHWHRLMAVLTIRLVTFAEVPVTLLDLIRFVSIVIAGLLFSILVRRLITRFAGEMNLRANAGTLYTLKRTIHYLILLGSLLVATASLGLDLDRLVLVVGALAVGVGFGLQGLANNLISGLTLLFDPKFSVGDLVELKSGKYGRVKQINIQNSVIRTSGGLDIIIPNSQIMAEGLTNWTMEDPHRRFEMPFCVGYGVSREAVRKAALRAASGVPFTVKKHPKMRDPEVRLKSFGDNGYHFELAVWVDLDKATQYGQPISIYNWALAEAFEKDGIPFAIPRRELAAREERGPMPLQSIFAGREASSSATESRS